MKVLITTDWYKPAINGVVTSVLNLEQELVKRGHEVRIVTLSQDFTCRKEQNVYYLKSVNVGRIYPYARASCFLSREYFDEIIGWAPDIIHSQCEFSSFYVAKKISRALGIPIVHTYHTVYEDYTHYFAPTRVWSRRLVACFSRQITNHAQSVIVPTGKVKDLLLGYGTTTEINVIPTGIDLEKYRQPIVEEEIDVLKIQLGIPQENKVLVTVGRLAKEKNAEELIAYFTKLNRDDMSMVIVGDGPYRAELERCAAESPASGRIYFTGMVLPCEVPLYYRLGDIFVCASNSETQGMTYIEAMASGLPVVCRKDRCVDGIVNEGRTGYQYTTFPEFETAVCAVLTEASCYARMAKAAEHMADAYSTCRFADRIEQVYYNELLLEQGQQCDRGSAPLRSESAL